VTPFSLVDDSDERDDSMCTKAEDDAENANIYFTFKYIFLPPPQCTKTCSVVESQEIFRRKMSPSSLGLKSKLSKAPA
jgi:hypothetical protein